MVRRTLLMFLVVLLTVAGSLFSPTVAAWEMRICAEPANLPYSHRSGSGFENRIAEIIAEELGARLTWVWVSHPHERAALMRRGECDIVMGVPDGHRGLLTTIAYYRSSYVFAYRSDAGFEVRTFDDEVLRQLQIGVPFDGRGTSPPAQALINRGLADKLEYFQGNRRQLRGETLIKAAAEGKVDLAIEWGPVAAYSVQLQAEAFTLVPVSPEFELPFLPMVFPITLGVRPGDIGLRDRLNVAIAERWEDIQSVLGAFDVPALDLPRPQAVTTGQR